MKDNTLTQTDGIKRQKETNFPYFMSINWL